MSSWPIRLLSEIAEVIDCKHRTPFYLPEGVPIISPGNIAWGALNFDDCKRTSFEEYQSLMDHCTVRVWDLVLSRNQTFGVAAYVSTDEPFALGQDTVLLQADGCVPQFLYFILQSSHIQDQITRLSGGSTFKRINLGDIRKLSVPLPPLPEQRKIAEILSTWDEAIALTGALIAALQTRKRALMQLLLTGEVRFPGFDAEWEEVQVKQLGKVSSGGTPDTTNSAYWDGDIMWCTPTEITAVATKYISETGRRITEEGLLNSSAVLLEPGSILLCTRATIGQMAINTVPMATNQGFKNLTLSGGSDARFIYYLLSVNKHELVRLANGSTFLELSKNDFEELAFTVPDAGEQMRIAEVLDTCDSEIEMYQQKMEILKTQKRGLMQQLLTGAVRV